MITRRGISYNSMESLPRGESTYGNMSIEQLQVMTAQFDVVRAVFRDLREESNKWIDQLE